MYLLPQDIVQIYMMDHAQESLNLMHCWFAAEKITGCSYFKYSVNLVAKISQQVNQINSLNTFCGLQ